MAFLPGEKPPPLGLLATLMSVGLAVPCLQAGTVAVMPAAAGTGGEAMTAAAVVILTDTLVVRSGTLADPVNPSVGGLVTRLDLTAETGSRDAAELLQGVAGFQVRRYGAVGASAVPSLRGSSAAQIQFFLDGMPLNGAQNGMTPLDRIPLARLQAVEIHRGVVPTGLGGLGGAGAVNFLSRADTEGVDIQARAGSFGELGGRVVAGLANDRGTGSGILMLYGLRADNDFSYLDHNQTFYNVEDDTVRTRTNAWIDRWGVWGVGKFETGRLVSRFSLGHDRRDGGRPGPLGHLSPNASVRYGLTDGQLHLDLDEGLLQLHLAGGRREEYLYDPEKEVGLGPPGTDRSLTRDLTGRLAWSPQLVSGLLFLETGVEGRQQRQQDWLSGREEPQRNRHTLSAFAAATVELADRRLQLAPAWRWQHTRDDFPPVPLYPWLPEEEAVTSTREDISPSVGLVWTAVAERLFLEGHAARTVRQPTWVELFGHRGGIDGNRELQAEDITAADVAISFRSGHGGFSARLAGFQNETDDKIIFIQNSQRTSKAVNAGRTTARGIELEVASQLQGAVSLTGNLTYQKAEDRGGVDPTYLGNKLPFLPDLEMRARLDWRPNRWTGWVEVAHLSANYRDRPNTELNKAPARTLLNLGLARDWSAVWLGPAGVLSLVAEVINLTDNAVYDVEGFPLPGRSWHLAARVRI